MKRNERSFLLTPWLRASLLFPLAVAAGAVVFFMALAGPPTHMEPRDLPVGVVGERQMATQLQEQLGSSEVGEGLEVEVFESVSAAEAAIQDREIYAAIVPQPGGGGELVVASAASPAVAQLLTVGVRRWGNFEVRDLVPAPEEDPRGAGLSGGALPITICGIATGAVALTLRSRVQQLAMVMSTSAVIGVAGIALLKGWLGALEGDALPQMFTLGLAVAAISSLAIGCFGVAGRVGLILLDVALVLIGNPLSGANAAPELLPFGEVGHWMPLGAAVDALRGFSAFDGAATTTPLLVLAGWVALGLLLVAVAHLRRPIDAAETADVGAGTAEPAAAH